MPSNSTYKNPTGSSVYGAYFEWICMVVRQEFAKVEPSITTHATRIDFAVERVRKKYPLNFMEMTKELREGGFL